MTTPIKQAIAICGLTQSEAANYLNVSPDTVKSWCSDRRTVPDGVWSELAKLYDHMEMVCDETIDLIEEQIAKHGAVPDNIEFSYSGEHGRWPSVGCAMTVEAMVRMHLIPLE